MKIMKINEMFNLNETSFISKEISVSIYDMELGDGFSTYGEQCNIKWKLEIEAREYGIKDLYPIIESIDLIYILENFELDKDKDVELTLTSDEWKFESTYNMNGDNFNLSIEPRSVEIFYDDKRVEISF